MGPSELIDELRPRIADRRVLDAIAQVDRAAFVPEELRSQAWANEALPIAHGQTISQPLVVARMAELLDVRPGDNVLDVGTGSGYAAAVLATLGGNVTSIERHRTLSLQAAGVLGDAARLVVGDGVLGWPPSAPYDVINVAASADAVPPALLEQLAADGRLVMPVGERLTRIRHERGEYLRDDHDPVRFVPLV